VGTGELDAEGAGDLAVEAPAESGKSKKRRWILPCCGWMRLLSLSWVLDRVRLLWLGLVGGRWCCSCGCCAKDSRMAVV